MTVSRNLNSKYCLISLLTLFLFLGNFTFAQQFPSRWDELTTSDWQKAVEKSNKTCILPIGVLEKHGPQGPIGSDLIHVREWAARATQKEYAVVFPDYFYGQINEARHQPGTFALPHHVMWNLLEATCDEIARNGFDKIIIVNKHGGNPEFLRYFLQSQLNRRKNYALYFFTPKFEGAYTEKLAKLRKSNPAGDAHAGESETSTLLYLRPDLVKMDKASSESGSDQKRLSLPNVYTAINWYARYPNHYAGEGEKASREVGELITEQTISLLIEAIKAVKSDNQTLRLQKEFYDRVDQLSK